MSVCYLVCAGEETALDFKVAPSDYVIACDGGLEYLKKYGYTPDLIVGDFDSLGYVPSGNVIRLDTHKDDTDLGYALNSALRYDEIRIYCALGGSLSHTLANFQSLIKLSRENKRAFLIGKDEVFTAITDGELVFEAGYGKVSVLAADVAQGVTLKGLMYPLNDYTAHNDYPIGVSNELIGVSASVKVNKGTLIVGFPSSIEYPRFVFHAE